MKHFIAVALGFPPIKPGPHANYDPVIFHHLIKGIAKHGTPFESPNIKFLESE